MDIDLGYRPDENLPYSELQRLLQAGPVFRGDNLGGWVVTSYEDVKKVLSDFRHFTSEGTPIGEAFGAEAMLVNDSPLHHTMRSVWAASVSKSAMAARSPMLEQIAHRLLAPLIPQFEAGDSVEITEVFHQYVAEMMGEMFRVSRQGLENLKRWSRMFADTPALELAEGTPAYEAHIAARQEVYDFLAAEMDNRRERLAFGETPDDLVTLMVAAVGQNGITETIALDNLLNFFLGALDTTAKWLGNIIVSFSQHPDTVKKIRSNPALLAPALEEVMRLDTVAQVLLRIVKKDGTMLAGQTLKAQDRVYVFPGVANRDPQAYEDPDQFNIHRRPKPHLGFGYGMHQCLGAATARQETLSFMKVLLDMVPGFEVTQSAYADSWAVWGPRSLHIRPTGLISPSAYQGFSPPA